MRFFFFISSNEIPDTHLKDEVELADGGERVRETLGAQVEQRLHEHVDLEGVEGALALHLGVLPGVGQVHQDVQHLLGRALLPHGHHHLMGRRRAGQRRCQTEEKNG